MSVMENGTPFVIRVSGERVRPGDLVALSEPLYLAIPLPAHARSMSPKDQVREVARGVLGNRECWSEVCQLEG